METKKVLGPGARAEKNDALAQPVAKPVPTPAPVVAPKKEDE